jgi:peptidoglycan/xylan/chitin deacetylase (PgdA/CDA1 family)
MPDTTSSQSLTGPLRTGRAAGQRVVRTAVRATGLRRRHVASVRMCCERNLLASMPGTAPLGPRVLCYHSVGTPEWGVNDVSPQRFRRQLELALQAGFEFVPLARVVDGSAPSNALALTFDDGLKSVATNAVPVLEEMAIPYTLFIVSGWADGLGPWAPELLMTWSDIEKSLRGGAEIGSHSVTHPDFRWLPRDDAAYEIGASREVISSRLGVTPTTFAIPYGQAANWSEECQAQAVASGYTTVFAQSDERRAAGTFPRTFITRWDYDRVFKAALAGKFDRWEEWV